MELQPTRTAGETPETAEIYVNQIKSLLEQIIRLGSLNLKVSSHRITDGSPEPDGPGWVVEFSGTDSDLLLEAHADLLDALAYVASKAVRLEEKHYSKVVFDCHDYRKIRAEELRLTAQLAAERVIESGESFALNPMNAADRRTIHLALKDQSGVRTESEGMGSGRKVVILPRETRDQRRETRGK